MRSNAVEGVEGFIKAFFADAVGERGYRRHSVHGIKSHAQLAVTKVRHLFCAGILKLALTAARIESIRGAFKEQLAVFIEQAAACVGKKVAQRAERKVHHAVAAGNINIIFTQVRGKRLYLVSGGNAFFFNVIGPV